MCSFNGSIITVWWMRVGINSQLPSISAFSTDLKEFKLHTDYSGISLQIQPSGGSVQVWVQVRAPAGHLAFIQNEFQWKFAKPRVLQTSDRSNAGYELKRWCSTLLVDRRWPCDPRSGQISTCFVDSCNFHHQNHKLVLHYTGSWTNSLHFQWKCDIYNRDSQICCVMRLHVTLKTKHLPINKLRLQ